MYSESSVTRINCYASDNAQVSYILEFPVGIHWIKAPPKNDENSPASTGKHERRKCGRMGTVLPFDRCSDWMGVGS